MHTTTDATPLRFNPFEMVHKALRHHLFETAIRIQKTDYADALQRQQLIENMEEVIELFEEHADTEDKHVFTMITGHDPKLVEDFSAQHVTDHLLGEALSHAVLLMKESNDERSLIHASRELLFHFNEFMAFNLTHMNGEETKVNSVLWKHYNDGQLLEKVSSIPRLIPPVQERRFRKWMILGNSKPDVLRWFTMVQQSAPPAVWADFVSLAQEVLSPEEANEVLAVPSN